MKKVPLRAGIIGLGVGEAHIQGYAQHPHCQIKTLCDFSVEKLNWARQKYPSLQVTLNADEILEDPEIDIVSIASYDNYHSEQILKAIASEKHVFVEKPLCLEETDAVRIRSLLRQKPNVKLSSNLILRKCPRFQLLKSLIEQGKFGELYYLEGDYLYGRVEKITSGWRGEIDFYSVVYGGAVHLIDLLLWLTGVRVVEVQALGNQIVTEDSSFRYKDFVVTLLKFENGLIAKISANFGCVLPHFHGLSVYGTKATFVNGNPNGWLYESRDREVKPTVIDAPYPGTQKGDLVGNFVDSILEEALPEVPSEDVFRTMAVCFAVEKAVATGQAVRVNYGEE